MESLSFRLYYEGISVHVEENHKPLSHSLTKIIDVIVIVEYAKYE